MDLAPSTSAYTLIENPGGSLILSKGRVALLFVKATTHPSSAVDTRGPSWPVPQKKSSPVNVAASGITSNDCFIIFFLLVF